MSHDIIMNNIPSTNISRTIHELSESYCKLITKSLPLKNMPSVMLWGPPGVGKSQAIHQIADNIEKTTKKKVVITDVRLLLFNPIDLRGIPTANEDKTLAVWLKPKIFQMDESESVINILFLDEISAAPSSVQAAAYQITLDRVVGEHRLPDNCIVIAAGNRMTDRGVTFKMPKPLSNRLMHFEVEVDFDSWKAWAISHNLHPKVLGFLSYRTEALLQFESASDTLAFATPRSWEMVSNLLTFINDDIDTMLYQIAGLIGLEAAMEFSSWNSLYKELPNVNDIFAGTQKEVPTRGDVLYALLSEIVHYAKTHRQDLSGIRNSIIYAMKFPADYSVILMKDYLAIDEDFKKMLLQIPEFVKWMSTKGKLLNGVI